MYAPTSPADIIYDKIWQNCVFVIQTLYFTHLEMHQIELLFLEPKYRFSGSTITNMLLLTFFDIPMPHFKYID